MPYDDGLVVDARPPEDAETGAVGTAAGLDSPAGETALAGGPSTDPTGRDGSPDRPGLDGPGALAGGLGTARLSGPLDAAADGPLPVAPLQVFGGDEDEDDTKRAPRRYDVPTAVTVSVVEGVFAPGRRATLQATVDGTPVRGLRVRLAGEPVGRTDANGRVRIGVPSTLAGETEVRLRRGSIDRSVRLDLLELRLSVRSSVLVLLPGVDATARVSVGDRPVQGARVYADGEPVGVTGPDGTVPLRLPVADATRLRATGPVMTTTTLVDGLYLRVVGLALLALSVLVGAVIALGRRGSGPVTAALSLLAGLPAALASLLARVPGVGRALAPGRLLEGVRRVLLVAGRVLHGSLPTTAAALSGLAALLRSPLALARALLGRLRSTAGSESATDAGAAGPPGTDDDTGGSLPVRTAWRVFVALLPVSGQTAQTMTPAEMARAGVESGLPRRPVQRLLAAYRDVTYGDRDPSSRSEGATEAVERLRDAADGTEGAADPSQEGDEGAAGPDDSGGGPDDANGGER